jgi:hypothetical protein
MTDIEVKEITLTYNEALAFMQTEKYSVISFETLADGKVFIKYTERKP